MKVVNKYHNVPYDVYIGRGSSFGNPYVIGIDGTREQVIAKYRKYFSDRLDDDLEFKKSVELLRGKTLACFCKPSACHGDVILEYLSNGSTTSIFDDRCDHGWF